MEDTSSRVTAEEFERLVRSHEGADRLFRFRVLSFDRGQARLRMFSDPRHLRHGGTVSGPVLFALADTALFAAVLTEIGMAPLAVTADFSIRFLRKPPAEDVVAEARLLDTRGGLAVGEVLLYSHGLAEPVAHGTGVYSLPAGPPAAGRCTERRAEAGDP